jgi:hypothetical protein
MNKLAETLLSVRNKVAQTNPELAESINDTMNDLDTNPMINNSLNPRIESFAKPKSSVQIVEDNGTIHSFAVEIKSSKNGPIPDTQLMSKILEAIENQSGSDDTMQMSAGDSAKFEVVSFKYERRDDKKNTK